MNKHLYIFSYEYTMVGKKMMTVKQDVKIMDLNGLKSQWFSYSKRSLRLFPLQKIQRS